MKLHDFYEKLSILMKTRDVENHEVFISIKSNTTTIGPSPSMKVSSLNVGIDWDSRKVFINPENPLVLFDDDIRNKIRTLEEKLGWCQYEKRNLKRENEKLKQTLKSITSSTTNSSFKEQ
jgi:hypothetical protein